MLTKLKISFPFSVLILFFLTTPVDASLTTITKDRQLVWNVLAIESSTDQKSLDITKSVSGEGSQATLALKVDGDKMYLNDLDVTTISDNLVEIWEGSDAAVEA